MSNQDPEMNAAIRRAQLTIGDFVKFVVAHGRGEPLSDDLGFMKAFFAHPGDPDLGEHMFVHDLIVRALTLRP
jgi:hypothetical protein